MPSPAPQALAAYAAETAGCVRCRLAETRSQVVFGSGNPDAELMIVGEAPGYHEDQGGLPFAGQAGELLAQLLAGIGLTPRLGLPRERAQVPAAAEPRSARGRDRRLRAAPLPPDRARATPCRRDARQLRHEAPLRPVARDHARARPGARGDARLDDGAPLPALPPGRRALHAVDAEGARGRLRAPARPARPRHGHAGRPRAARLGPRGASSPDRGSRPRATPSVPLVGAVQLGLF